MRSTLLAGLALFAAAAPLAAQAAGGHQHDPAHHAAGSGKLPEGWMLRFDPVRAGQPAPKLTGVNFMTMGPALHIISGPANAIYYNTKDTVSGEFMVKATFAQKKTNGTESYGIFFAGANLQDSTQRYIYFLIRPNDGMFYIARRTSDARPTAIVPWTASDLVNKQDASGAATNTVMVHVAKDELHFILNNKPLRAIRKADLGITATDGLAGLRINHNLDLHVTDMVVKKDK